MSMDFRERLIKSRFLISIYNVKEDTDTAKEAYLGQ